MVDLGVLSPGCPTCGHGDAFHDVYDYDDPYPTCCIEGCTCGHPGDAVLTESADGTVTVERADHLILVSRELLNNWPNSWPRPEPDVLQLDTAGEYRYRYLRPYRDAGSGVDVYERITDGSDT